MNKTLLTNHERNALTVTDNHDMEPVTVAQALKIIDTVLEFAPEVHDVAPEVYCVLCNKLGINYDDYFDAYALCDEMIEEAHVMRNFCETTKQESGIIVWEDGSITVEYWSAAPDWSTPHYLAGPYPVYLPTKPDDLVYTIRDVEDVLDELNIDIKYEPEEDRIYYDASKIVVDEQQDIKALIRNRVEGKEPTKGTVYDMPHMSVIAPYGWA